MHMYFFSNEANALLFDRQCKTHKNRNSTKDTLTQWGGNDKQLVSSNIQINWSEKLFVITGRLNILCDKKVITCLNSRYTKYV